VVDKDIEVFVNNGLEPNETKMIKYELDYLFAKVNDAGLKNNFTELELPSITLVKISFYGEEGRIEGNVHLYP